jgi:hypothetical protein
MRVLSQGYGELGSARRMNEEREVQVSCSNDGFREDRRAWKPTVRSSYRIDPIYKDAVYAQKLLCIPLDSVKASGVRLAIPPTAGDGNQCVAVSEVEVITAEPGPLAIHHLLAADLDADGRDEWIVNAGEGVITVLDAGGELRWRHEFAAEVSGVDVGDLNGDGRGEVLCSCYDLNVYAFSAGGALLWKTDFENLHERSGRQFPGGEGQAPYGVGFWDLGRGMRRVLVGGYENQLYLLDEEGTLLQQYYPGYSMFQRTFVSETPDLDGDGLREKLMCSMKYGQSGVIHVIVGGADGRIVGHRNTSIPDNLPYTVRLVGGEQSVACAITPTGYGAYDLARNFPEEKGTSNVLGEVKGGTPLSAGLLHDIDGDGRAEFVVASRDGFLTIRSPGGDVEETRLIGEEVLDMAAVGAGREARLLLATPRGLLAYDREWRLESVTPGSYARVRAAGAGGRSVLAATEDGRLQMLRMP